MNTLAVLKTRFRAVLEQITDDNIDALVGMITQTQDARHGDYQANCAMPLKAKLGKPPRQIAEEIVGHLDLDDICEPPEIAGPGFINIRLKDDWLVEQLGGLRSDKRLGIAPTTTPKTFVIDFSSPNVAKPMHVGHIRSTVIGDALCRILRFLGHSVVSDNHLGDWGTQFGMIIYGYRHFVDQEAYEAQPVQELGRVYREVRALMDYHDAVAMFQKQPEVLATLQAKLKAAEQEGPTGDAKADKKQRKAVNKLRDDVKKQQETCAAIEQKIAAVESDPSFKRRAVQHADIANAVLEETAKLHAGDAANRKLWEEFLPKCREEIDRIYKRLDVEFDEELGESFYHDKLAGVVSQLQQSGMARESDGAMCVFLDGYEAPMIVQKKDGAYLYATTDLATIAYRMERWNPDAILYVVDFRQGEHFGKLFAAAKQWGHDEVELAHVSFGTVLGEDGKPLKTRSGVLISLDSLLDEAVDRAHKIVCENDDPDTPRLDDDQRRQISQVVGHSAIKYADLSQNRTSDYVFDYDKMVETKGNTATYIQYSYARIQSILSKGGIDVAELRRGNSTILLTEELERSLAIQLLRFEETLDETTVDYRPNLLCAYLFQLSKLFAKFFSDCPVLKADEPTRQSRLLLCDLVARTMKQGLELLGIPVIDKM